MRRLSFIHISIEHIVLNIKHLLKSDTRKCDSSIRCFCRIVIFDVRCIVHYNHLLTMRFLQEHCSCVIRMIILFIFEKCTEYFESA